jgi:hypothetical protein
MYLKYNQYSPLFERSPGTQGNAARSRADRVIDTKTPFALLLHEVLQDTNSRTEMADPSTPLDSEKVQELIQKMREMMNYHLLSLIDGGEGYGGFGSFFQGQSLSPVWSPISESASKNQHVSPKNEMIVQEDEIEQIIGNAAEAYGVDRDLIRSVVRVESGFEVMSRSPKGAQGLMQLMPETARELGVHDSFDPVENVMGGTRYLKRLLDRYQGDKRLALAAYNWGMGNLERNPDKLPRETARYVSQVLKQYDAAKA